MMQIPYEKRTTSRVEHKHTYTLIQYVGLSVYQAAPGLVIQVSVVPCGCDGRRFRVLLSHLLRCQSASAGRNKLMKEGFYFGVNWSRVSKLNAFFTTDLKMSIAPSIAVKH